MKGRVSQIRPEYGSLIASRGGVALEFLKNEVSGNVKFDDLQGRRVTYEVGQDETGRTVALDVKVM